MNKSITFIVFLFFIFSCSFSQKISLNSNKEKDTVSQISLLFTGDIMGHDAQIEAAYDGKTGKYDYSDNFKYLQQIIKSVDFAVGNLEVTLAGKPYKGYPQFSSPDALAKTYKM